jgi:hypothetical protein
MNPVDKGHLEIDLSELGLTVFAAVFVAETAGELEVARDGAGADEELFGLLGGLGEGVEGGVGVLGGGTGRDEELACAFWRGAEEDGCFYFGEL